MTRFEFDPAPSPGTNRTAAITDCATCGGHRLVPIDEDEQTYARCPDCNPAPAGKREPVAEDAWWKR